MLRSKTQFNFTCSTNPSLPTAVGRVVARIAPTVVLL
jgi:hypothetical protein